MEEEKKDVVAEENKTPEVTPAPAPEVKISEMN